VVQISFDPAQDPTWQATPCPSWIRRSLKKKGGPNSPNPGATHKQFGPLEFFSPLPFIIDDNPWPEATDAEAGKQQLADGGDVACWCRGHQGDDGTKNAGKGRRCTELWLVHLTSVS
jgi:hypothetical protein